MKTNESHSNPVDERIVEALHVLDNYEHIIMQLYEDKERYCIDKEMFLSNGQVGYIGNNGVGIGFSSLESDLEMPCCYYPTDKIICINLLFWEYKHVLPNGAIRNFDILIQSIPTLFANKNFQNIFVHEYIHYLDSLDVDFDKLPNINTAEDYYWRSDEQNAHMIQLIQYITQQNPKSLNDVAKIIKSITINHFPEGLDNFIILNYSDVIEFIDCWWNHKLYESSYGTVRKLDYQKYFRSLSHPYHCKTLLKSILSEGIVDKDGYYRKQLYADNKMKKNKLNENLTEEQHDALATVCQVRHLIHTHQEDMWNTESAQYEELWGYLDADIGATTLNKMLEIADLPPIQFSVNFVNIDNDAVCYELDYSEEEREEAHNNCLEAIEQINKDIENYLAQIDEKYGTNYCPTGKSRIL